jgi:hypothetical protein
MNGGGKPNAEHLRDKSVFVILICSEKTVVNDGAFSAKPNTRLQ